MCTRSCMKHVNRLSTTLHAMGGNSSHGPRVPDDHYLNREVERIANLMLHDGVHVDEQDAGTLDTYARQVDLAGYGTPPYRKESRDELARSIVYEALLYRKMKTAAKDGGNILERGSEFGAGFS